MSQLDGDDSAGFNKVGINAGLRGDVYFSEKMQVGMELTFSQRGSRSELGTGPNPASQLKIDLNYIQVPILVRYNDWYVEDEEFYRVNAFAGFSYGRLISSKAQDSKFDGNTDLFQKNDVGFHIGVSYLFSNRFGVTVRFNRGVRYVFNTEVNPLISRNLTARYLTIRAEYSL